MTAPHIVLYESLEKKLMARCSCGAEWSLPLTVTTEYRDSIEESHRRYFNRKPLETL